MLLAAEVIDTRHSFFEHAKEVFGIVCREALIANVLVGGMPDGLMVGELFAGFGVEPALIRNESA